MSNNIIKKTCVGSSKKNPRWFESCSTAMSTEKHDDISRIFDDTGKSMDQNVIFDQFLKIQLSPDISSQQSKKKYPNLPP